MKTSVLSIVLVVPLLFCSSTFAADWGFCADELYELRQAVSDAEDAARDVDSKTDDYAQCKLLPIMDLWNDGCRTMASGYEYELSNLQGALEAVDKRIRSVSSSCAASVSTLRPPALAPRSNRGSR